jgi:RimJ/RimL family protein N-acetyltransferase
MAATDPFRIDLPAELHGPRVLLRPWRESDAAPFWEAIQESRETLSQWLPWAREYESEQDCPPQLRRMQAQWLTRENLIVGIFERSSGNVLGGSGLHRIDWKLGKFEIGYWLRDSAVGHGYVTETVQVLTTFAFETLQAQRVQIRMDVRNTRSRNIPERLGFIYEGCLRRLLPDVDGTPRDTDYFALIREDYERLSWPGLS